MTYEKDNGSHCGVYLNKKAKSSLVPYIKEKF